MLTAWPIMRLRRRRGTKDPEPDPTPQGHIPADTFSCKFKHLRLTHWDEVATFTNGL
jgi:hypothetical protein